MIFLISLALTALFIRFCAKSLKEHPVPYYLAATLVAAAVFACTVGGVRFPGWFNSWVWPIFSRSALASAMFVVIMWTGALPNGSAAIKKLMPIRGELSILASILTLGHNAAYGMTYFRMLFTRPERLPVNQLWAAVCSLVMIAIMLPLFVTSFKSVRRKMSGRNWKRLQRFAYGFYALMYIHVMLLTVPYAVQGKTNYIINLFAYSAIFLGYAVCRILKHRAMRSKDTAHLVSRQKKAVAAALVVSVCLTVAVCAFGGSTKAGDGEPVTEFETTQEADEGAPEEDSPSNQAEETGKTEETAPEAETESESMEELPEEVEAEGTETIETDAEKPESETTEEVEPTPAPETEQEPVVVPTPAPETEQEPVVEPTPAPETEQEPVVVPMPAPQPEPEPEPVRIYKNGSFSGSGEGFMGMITVNVNIQDDVITGISVTSAEDDEPYLSDAEGVIARILSAQSADVDTVSGATFSSEGIIAAVKAALASAKN